MAPLSVLVHVRADDESRLTRLERRAADLAQTVSALEEVIGEEDALPELASERGDASFNRTTIDRIRRLERRLSRLGLRIELLEDAVLAPSQQVTPSAPLVTAAFHDRGRASSLRQLERSLANLERRAGALAAVLPSPTPTAAPTSPLSSSPPSPSPTSASPSPSTSSSSTAPPSPSTQPSASCQGTAVTPNVNLQSLINARPSGTTFCFVPGTYQLPGTVWTGDKAPILDLRSGAVIDGRNGSFVGINGADAPPGQPGTVILGGIFQNFGNATSPNWISPLILHVNWVVEGSEFRNNFNAGLSIQGDNVRVTNIFTHHNGRYGITASKACATCTGPTGVLIEDSEIAFNNTRRLPTNNDAGGTKFSGATRGMIVRGNDVHDNYGSGLWWDGYHRDAQVYDNYIYGNRNWGIMWEISYGGTKIHHNLLIGNGASSGTLNFFNTVQLLISCSDGGTGGIEIYENTIDGTAYPLVVLNHNVHPIRTRQVYVHHNVMTLRSLATRVGGYARDGLIELFAPGANNRFDHNTYRVSDPSKAYWAWNNQTLTWSQWRAAGQDTHGAVQALA